MTRTRITAAILATGLALSACGADDGARVRQLDGDDSSSSDSSSDSGSSSSSGSASEPAETDR